MGLAVISMIILLVIALIAVPVLIRVFGAAADTNPNQPGSDEEEEDGEQQSTRSGPRR